MKREAAKKPELLMAQQNCPTRTVDTELTCTAWNYYCIVYYKLGISS
jgi:hypothetical protein